MPRNLALNISVGGLLDKSLGTAYAAATKSTQKLGKEYRDTNKQLKAVRDIQRYERQLETLKRKQRETGDESGKLGAGIAALEKKYKAATASAKRYGIQVGDIIREEKRLTDQLKKQQRAQKMKATAGKIGGGMKSAASGAAGLLGPAGLIGGTVIGGGITALTMTNQMMAEQANLARASKMNVGNYRVWDKVLGQMGLNGEHATDMIQELNNKMGEAQGLGEMPTALKEGLEILKLDYDLLEKMKPEEQYLAILDAAQKLENQQQGITAVDMIMGGEATKIVGFLQEMDGSINDVFDDFKKMNVVSAESITGARSFTESWSKFTYVMGGAFQQLSGLVGGVLAPQLTAWAEQFSNFLNDPKNKEQIKKFSEGFGDTLLQLGKGLAMIAQNLPTIVRGFVTVMKWLGGDGEEQESGVARANRLRAERRQAAVAEAGRNTGRGGMIRNSGNVTNAQQITIIQQPGQSPQSVVSELEKRQDRSAAEKVDNYGLGLA